VSAEAFTILAIMEARDRASEIFAKVDESLNRFSQTAVRAADIVKGAGDSIDESLLKTASGADALDLAEARVSAAQEKAIQTTAAPGAISPVLLPGQSTTDRLPGPAEGDPRRRPAAAAGRRGPP
jgi:hypothetical protein